MSEITFAPLAEIRENFRVRWYRCPIPHARLRALSRRSDARGAVQAVGHLALWAATGALAYHLFQAQSWWGFALVLFLHGTVATFFSAPHHELSHGTVFRTKWLNPCFLGIYSTLGWYNFHIYQFSHSYHHRFTLHVEGDREVVLPKTPTLRFLYLLQLFTINLTGGFESRGVIPTLRNMAEIASNRFDAPYNEWGPELYEGQPEERRKAALWARWVLCFHAVVIVGSFALGEPILAVLLSGHVFIGNAHRYFVGAPMHCGLRSNVPDFRKSVRTITLDPLSEFLYWHMNWHLEHHMYAGVPCYNLKALHEAVADDMPAPRTLLGAWREMRDVMRRQESEPDYAFDTPVPPSAEATTTTNDPLAASIGDLAPKAIA